MSGEEPGYVPPDHKTTAEFRAPRGAAEPEAAAPGPEATFVDEPADDLFDSGATLQDFPECDPETGPPTPEGSMADATFVDVLFDDPPYQDDDPEDDRDDEAPVTVAEPLDTITDTPSSATGASAGGAHASVTATDVPVPFKRSEPPEAIMFEMPAPVYGQAAPVPEQAAAPGDTPAAMQEQAPPVQEATADQQAPAPGTASDPATAPPPEEQATADQHAAAPVPPAPAPAEAPWTEQFAAEGESADPANPAFAYAMPGPPPQGSAPPQEGTAPAMPPAASPSGGVLPGPSGPTGPSGSGRRPILFVALAAGVVVLLAAAGVTVLLLTSGSDKEEPTTTSPSPAASAPAAQGGGPAPTTSGGAAPSGAPAAPPAGGPTGGPAGPPAGGQPASPPVPTAPIGPVKQGDGITYQLVQQDEGYFEGRMTITNRTGKPMKTWKLTFGTPGAKVKNIWGAELVKGGEKAEIKNLDDAPPIPPGGTWAVQFGAEGAATTPKGCKLNGEACGF